MAGLAGCVEGIQSHFQGSFQGIIPIEITNESERSQNIVLESREEETGRETYEQSFNVNIDERVQPQHLGSIDQQFRVTRIEGNEPVDVESAAIRAEANLVLIRLYEDEIELEVVYDEAEAENATAEDAAEPGSADDGETTADTNEAETAADADAD